MIRVVYSLKHPALSQMRQLDLIAANAGADILSWYKCFGIPGDGQLLGSQI
jgi:hypothetical protein